jgi:hypothetical protein
MTNGTAASLAPGTVQSDEELEYKDCTLNVTTGVFGSSSNGVQLGAAASDGGLDESANTTTRAGEVVVPYTYQVETTVGVRDDITILDDVLLTLEYAMTERLIPLLLRDQCDNVGGIGSGGAVEVRSATTAVAEATSTAALVVTGIAVAPPDEIDPDKTCRNVAAADDAVAGLCFVLSGRLTIHYQQHPDHMATASSSAAAVAPSAAEERQQQQQLVDHVRGLMEREIQSGRFDHAAVAPAITRVGLYVEDDKAGGSGDDSDEKGGNDKNATLMLDQNTNKPLIGSLVGVFATVTIFATILIRRQWRVRRHRYNMTAGRAQR